MATLPNQKQSGNSVSAPLPASLRPKGLKKPAATRLTRPSLPAPAGPSRPGGPTAAEVAKYGPQVATWLAGMTWQQRGTVKQAAAKGGFQLAGLMPQADGNLLPTALRPMRDSALVKQATQLTDSAFRPLSQALDARQARTVALDAKRAADFKYYSEWMQQQRDNMDAKARAADASLSQATNASTAAINADTLHNTVGDAASQAQAQPGMVGQFAGTPQAALVQAAANRSAGSLQVGQDALNNQLGGAEADRQRGGANALAYAASLDAGRVADTRSSLDQIDQDRMAVGAQRGQSYSTTLSTLRQNEANKASDVADRSITMQELNIKRDTLSASAAQDKEKYAEYRSEFLQKYGLSPERFARMGSKERLRWATKWARKGLAAPKPPQWKQDWNGDGKIDLKDKQAFTDASTATATKQAALLKGKKGDKKPGLTDGQRTASRNAYLQVTNTMHALGGFRAKFGNGRDKKGRDIQNHVIATTGADIATIQLAQIIRTNHGHLTPRGLALAKQLGILRPETIWPLLDSAKIPPLSPPPAAPTQPGKLPTLTTNFPS